LPDLLSLLSQNKDYKFLLLCDDLSFDAGENTYKSLKAALDGGIEGKPENVLFYATSNRRHLMPRDMMENERSTAINPSESVEEKVSLSDRFGIWIGFHNMSQEIFLEIIYAYCNEFKITENKDVIRSEALEWSITRGARSGRVAWQFVQDLAGRNKIQIN
jgi:predicted AAA+ superfamily ATPase